MGWRYTFGIRRWHGRGKVNYNWQFDNIHRRRPPLKERSALYRRTGGHRPTQMPKPRCVTKAFNNEWQKGRYLQVENLGFVEACQERGITVCKPEDIFTSHLPIDPENVPEDLHHIEPLVKGPIRTEQEHPYFHERPIRDYSTLAIGFPKGIQVECAKVLTKAVEVEEALPGRLLQSISELQLPDDIDDLAKNVLMESRVYDATQKKLPVNAKVPYIGWHPVEDRMFRPMPYKLGDVSWNRRVKREYGIPEKRKNMNVTRGFLRICDMMASERPGLLNRIHLEETVSRQFLERGQDLLRFHLPLHQVITDTRGLPAYADGQAVKGTENIPLPDIFPLEPHAHFQLKYVYNDEIVFPLKPIHSVACAQYQIHSGIEHINSFTKEKYHNDNLKARSLVNAFILALGQAKLKFGPEVKGELPSPVTVNFITTDGKRVQFSAFQLNTLDLDNPEGVKNIYWCDPTTEEMFGTCDYVKAIPTLENYNKQGFRKFAALYLENSN